MPKKRQIRFFHGPRILADGSEVFDWKPSNALRDQGWEHVTYRNMSEAEAAADAIERNNRLDAWRNGENPTETTKREEQTRLVRWDGLIKRFHAADDYRDLKKSTRKEYDTRIRSLRHWASDGRLIVRQIDYDMVQDLKRSLKKGGSSDHRIAAMMRVLRLLLSFAEREGIIKRGSNPASNAKIKEPAARLHVLSLEAVEHMAATAEANGHPNLSLAILLGFWTVQRQADLLLNFNRLAWRELHGIEARDAALLAGNGGRVMGFRHMPGKTEGSTGVWIDAPVPPFLHDAIEAAWKRPAIDGHRLLRDDLAPGKPLEDWRLQRMFRNLRAQCAHDLREQGRLLMANEIESGQFRDLRRSGQVYFRDAGAKNEIITSLSGHTILARKSVLDIYMPADTAAACAAVAWGLRLRQRQRNEGLG